MVYGMDARGLVPQPGGRVERRQPFSWSILPLIRLKVLAAADGDEHLTATQRDKSDEGNLRQRDR